MAKIFSQAVEPGTRLNFHSDIARLFVAHCPGGARLEFTVLAGQSFTLISGTEGIEFESFDIEIDGPVGLRLAPDSGST